MKYFILFLIAAILGAFNSSAYADDNTSVQITSESAKLQEGFQVSRMRRPENIVYLAQVGTGISSFQGRSSTAASEFNDATGVALPMYISAAIFPKTPTEGNFRFGYTLDFGYNSKNNSILIASESSDFYYAMIGINAVYFLNPERTWYARGGIGFAQMGFRSTFEVMGKEEETVKDTENGAGAFLEIGKGIQLNDFAPFAISFTVRDISSGTFESSNLNVLIASLNVGMLY